jgi:hypothetical protein
MRPPMSISAVFPRRDRADDQGDLRNLSTACLSRPLKELDEARDWMLTLGRKTASEKVASFLYLIATQCQSGSRSGFGKFRIAADAIRHCGFSRPDDRDGKPATDQIAQGRDHPYPQQSSCRSARSGQVGRTCLALMRVALDWLQLSDNGHGVFRGVTVTFAHPIGCAAM